MSRIMQVLPALESGGVERGTVDIAKALLASGHSAYCVSSGGRLVSELESHGARHITLPVHTKNPLQIAMNGRRLAQLIRHHKIDLLHVRSRAPAWSCLLAGNLACVPVVSTFHGQYGAQNRLKRFYNSAMLRSDHTIAVSDFIAHHIQTTYPEMQPKLSTIYRGIDTDYFNPDQDLEERKNTLRAQWALSKEQLQQNRLILLPGRVTRLKGHKLFLQALAQLKNQNFIALIVGETLGRSHYLEELERLSAKLNLQSKLKFLNTINDMPAAYALADVVVSASTKPESFGRVCCEAQAMQALVVASNHGGSTETFPPCQQQGLFKPDDATDLARALDAQLTLPGEQADKIGQESRQHIVERFSLQQMCEQTLALYQSVLAKHKA